MPPKAEQIADLEVAYVQFRDLFSMLPDDWFQRAGLGDWTLAELLAHMAGWYRALAVDLTAVAMGGEAHPRGYYEPEDEWNARFTTEARAGTAALDDFDMAFHESYAGLKALNDDTYGPDGFGSRALQGVGLKHFEEHHAAIDAWVQR